jgi:hypothetical protein
MVLLRPLFGARAHERQRDRAGEDGGFAALDGAKEIGRADAEVAAARREQLAGELIVGQVVPHRRAHPAMIRLRGVRPEVDGKFRFNPQQIAPLRCPIIGKLLAGEEVFNQSRALVGRRVLQEAACFRRRGQSADDIEEGATDEGCVRAQRRGFDPEVLQAGEHDPVDVIPRQGGRGCIRFNRTSAASKRRAGQEDQNEQSPGAGRV